MLSLLLAAQIAAAQPRDTATYSSAAVRALTTAAARMNHLVPSALGAYRARLETEISIGSRNGAGVEGAVSVEQMASTLDWDRTGALEQHVIGYRNQSVGVQLATLPFFRNAWAVPSLYGNRLALLFGRDSSSRARGGANRRTTYAVHPLSDDRERFYRYAGGDTIQALRVGDREIRIVRLDVTPREGLPPGTTVFTGEIDLDLARFHVVRMRGSFQSIMRRSASIAELITSAAQLEGIVYVELENSEVEQQFWLPAYQRFDFQAQAASIGDAKAVFRISSRFRDVDVRSPALADVAPTDTLRVRPHRLTIATTDSLGQFSAWRSPLGAQTATMSTEDFTDVAPPKWRATGEPIVVFQAERVSDLVRVNRIEGLFTGGGVGIRFRDVAPGLTARAVGGFAWQEQTVRGRLTAALTRGPWITTARVGRSLDLTNDFRAPFDSGSSLGAVFGTDDYDYVDRRSAMLGLQHQRSADGIRVRTEVGYAQDDRALVHMTKGVLGGDPFRANRRVDRGDYLASAVTFEWHPDVAAEFVRPGIGARLRYERGDGTLLYQRAELRISARQNRGPWVLAARFDAGALLGPGRPTQQLFEIGEEQNLPGYGYKEFAGDQAAVARVLALYSLGVWKAPIRLNDRLWLPALAPALSFSLQSGWTGVSNDATRAALARLGIANDVDPRTFVPVALVSRATGDPRTSVSVGLRFFGGAIGIAAARPLDHVEPWRVRAEFGRRF
jgi:hypothetical protein